MQVNVHEKNYSYICLRYEHNFCKLVSSSRGQSHCETVHPKFCDATRIHLFHPRSRTRDFTTFPSHLSPQLSFKWDSGKLHNVEPTEKRHMSTTTSCSYRQTSPGGKIRLLKFNHKSFNWFPKTGCEFLFFCIRKTKKQKQDNLKKQNKKIDFRLRTGKNSNKKNKTILGICIRQ